MPRPARVVKRLLPPLVVITLATAACGGGGGGPTPTPQPAVTGSGGTFTAGDATTVVSGVCDMQDLQIGLDRANTIFFERVHEHLHVLAAAVEPIDRNVSADLFEAKERVELDLAEDPLPASYSGDVKSLLGAVGAALDTAGLPSHGCT